MSVRMAKPLASGCGCPVCVRSLFLRWWVSLLTTVFFGDSLPLKGPAALVDSIAWWLLTGVGQPDMSDLVVYGSNENRRQRQEVAGQVQRLLNAAEASGIGPALRDVLSRLVQKRPTP